MNTKIDVLTVTAYELKQLFDSGETTTREAVELPPECSDQDDQIKARDNRSSAALIDAAQLHIKEVAREGVKPAMSDHDVNIIVAPDDSCITSLATAARWPVAAVPNGILSEYGRPHGLSIIAKMGKERELLKFMFAFEKTFSSRPVSPGLK